MSELWRHRTCASITTTVQRHRGCMDTTRIPAADTRTRYRSAVRSRPPSTTVDPAVTLSSVDQPGVEPESSE